MRYEWEKLKERIITAVVWALPKKIIYWSAIRLMAHATTGEHGNTVVPELTGLTALKRWETA